MPFYLLISVAKYLLTHFQAGAWACFDEFNRIELEVLSVVAQQILSIQRAIQTKAKRFLFEGTWLSVEVSMKIFPFQLFFDDNKI